MTPTSALRRLARRRRQSSVREQPATNVPPKQNAFRTDQVATVLGMAGMWSGQTLRERLVDLVDPFDPDRVEQTAYALAVGHQVVVTGTSPAMRRDLAPNEIFEIPPGQFAYILTEETIKIPPDVLGLLSMKFGQKIRGLINVSGFHVDPGYRGRLLFAVYNAGPQSVMLTRGAPTFLLWITPLDQPTDRPYTGAEDSRTEITAEEIMKIQGEVSTPQALAQRVADLEQTRDRFSSSAKTLGRFIVGAIISVIVGATALYVWDEVSDSVGGDGTQQDQQPTETSVP